MKLFTTLSAAAVVSAQFDGFANLNDLFASLQNDLITTDVTADSVRTNEGQATTTENAASGARYIQATVTATTSVVTTPPTPAPIVNTVGGCWKCDAMTFAQCAVSGNFETCASDSDTTTGRDAVCFLEMRETNQKLQQLCTGCKSANACANLKAQNFVGSGATGGSRRAGRFNDQCKNEWFIQTLGQRYGSSQSTCRTCFATCTDNAATGHNCFGGLNGQDSFADQFLYPTFGATNGQLKSGSVALGQTSRITGDALLQATHTFNDGQTTHVYGSFGIPTGVFADSVAEIQDNTAATQLMWGAESSATTTGNGKDSTTRGNRRNTQTANDHTNMYLYWAIQDAPKVWWEMDLIQVASDLQQGTGPLAGRLTGGATLY